MAKSLGYYGINTHNSLVLDIVDEWGECLQKMCLTDNIWLLHELAGDVFDALDQDDLEEINEELSLVQERLRELQELEVISLIQMLCANNGKSFGFWSLFQQDNRLISDMSDKWGEALQLLSESDRYWLIARCSFHLWLKYHPQIPSDEARILADRVNELSLGDLQGLIQALADD